MMITPSQATVETFLTAFYTLSKPDQSTVIQRLLEDQRFLEDLRDIASLEQRRHEPSQPLAEYLATLIQQRRDVFVASLLEAIEEMSLANAIREGRSNDFVSEDRILKLLEEEP